jgi:hypothetical protein
MAGSAEQIDAVDQSSFHRGQFSAVGSVSSSSCTEQVPVRINAELFLVDAVDQDEVPFEMRGRHVFGPTCFVYEGDLMYEGMLIRQGSSYKWQEGDADDDWYLDLTLSADGKTLAGTFRNEHHYTGPDGRNTGTATGEVILTQP